MVTVSDLLAQPDLRLVPLVAGDPSREIRWVATSELADPTPFLEGGELLLTTGLGTKEWEESAWREYVDRLATAGVTALGLGTGLTHRDVPAHLLRACEATRLALLEVPAETTFVAVSRTTAGLLEVRERALALEALAKQRALTQAALVGDGTSGLLRELARVLRGAACLLTPEGPLAAGPFGDAADRLDIDEVQEEVRRIRRQGLRASAGFTAGGTTTVVHPVGLQGRPTGYLAAMSSGRLTPAERGTVATAVALLSLAVQRRRDERDNARLIRARAAELLAGGDARSARLVLALVPTGPDQQSLPPRGQVLLGAGEPDLVEDALVRLEERGLVAASLHGRLWVLSPATDAADVADALRDAGLLVGVGQACALDETSRSHTTATHALAQATPTVPVVHWERMVGVGPMALLDRAQAELYASSYLAPLTRPGDAELVTTLHAFLRHHGSLGKVATDLAVHRNTVRNRVAAIERLLGESLDDPQVRANAWLALQADPGRPWARGDGAVP